MRTRLAACFFVCLLIVPWDSSSAQTADSLLWDPEVSIPHIDELQSLEDVQYATVKKIQTDSYTYKFLHGVAIAFYRGKLYASFALNSGEENTVSEEAHYCVSGDLGRSWSNSKAIDTGEEEHLAVSHGVFLPSQEGLWAFQGCFYGKMQNVHMRAYLLNEENGSWENKGVVAESGFWPMDEPEQMDNGNWIVGGISVGKTTNIHGPNHSAVAISHGSNLLKWDVIKIRKGSEIGEIWGESTILVKGKLVRNISRYGENKKALVAYSDDFGRTWSCQTESNLPMATSKPFSGILSTGHSFLISNSALNIEARRPLTIAIGQPGEPFFSDVFCIRKGVVDSDNVGSSLHSSLSYPYAIEHAGKLYVGYSNDVGRGKNRNNAEIAVIPLHELIRPANKASKNSVLNSIPDTIFYDRVDEGHLQGIVSDYRTALYWSNTSLLVKTDLQGNVITSTKVPSHHGDLDYYEGKIYVAVNLGLFNKEEGFADSWIYVYDEQDLRLIGKYSVPEVIHGAGGLAINGNRIMVVGGLPDNGKYNENFVYEYTMDFTFVKTHTLKTGYTQYGIQTAAYNNGSWYFGCYGSESKSLAPILIKAKFCDDVLKLDSTYNRDFSFGMIGLSNNRWLISNNLLNNSACVIQFKD